MSKPIFDINPDLDIAGQVQMFAERGRVQVRNVLTDEAARTVQAVLHNATPWGVAFQAGDSGPQKLRHQDLERMDRRERESLARAVQQSAAQGDYAVRFGQYPILDAYLGKWAPGGPHDLLLEHINAEPFLNLIRAVTGIPELVKADAQATRYGPGDFLSIHNDSHVAEGWRVAYILSFALPDWKPDWGGYLNFLNADGDVVEGWRPRFNALNLLRVPQLHNVSYVPPFAPVGRYAITGWFRDR